MEAMSKLTCEVCNKEPALGVACVPGIPYSAAYGRECLKQRADPYPIIRANVECCGGTEYIRQEYLETITYFQDRYMTLREALAADSRPLNCL